MTQTKENKGMTTKKAHRATWAAMALASSFTFLFGMAPQMTAAAQTPAADNHTLSPSEVKTLIRGASTPEDHLKLATYFKQEALDEDGRGLRTGLSGSFDVQTALVEGDAKSLQGICSQREQSRGSCVEDGGRTREDSGNDAHSAASG
jgi:hypothetical protein